jgi:hypothetical protein
MVATVATEASTVTEARRKPRRPGPGAVIWGSIALFAVLFALLTYQLSSSSGPSTPPVVLRKVVKRRVVTTIVPTPGRSSVTAGPVVSSQSTSGANPVTTSAS